MATLEGGQLAYGVIAIVAQTAPRQLLYVVEYADGDIVHLVEPQAIAAKAMALASVPTITPPLRTLRRRDANAHSREEAASGSRTLTSSVADAHFDDDEWLLRLLQDELASEDA